jgi:hypothetical protein
METTLKEACKKWTITEDQLNVYDLKQIQKECEARIKCLKIAYANYEWKPTLDRLKQREEELNDIKRMIGNLTIEN